MKVLRDSFKLAMKYCSFFILKGVMDVYPDYDLMD
jgi:hypothetical protein